MRSSRTTLNSALTTPTCGVTIGISILTAVLLVSPYSWAGGANTFTLQPTAVTAGQIVQLRVDSSDGCYGADNIMVERSSGIVDVRFTIADYGPCQPTWFTPRFVPLGTFGPGTYVVRITECKNAPINPCTLRTTLSLKVTGGANAATPVPASSWAGLGLLGFGVLCAYRRMRA
jgi:hypothetical protein